MLDGKKNPECVERICFDRWIAWGALAGVFLLALAVRLTDWYFDPVIERDGVFYLEMIRNWPDIQSPPLFPAIVWRLSQLGADVYSGAVGVNMVCGALLPVIFWQMLRWYGCGYRLAFAGSLLVCFCPPLVNLSHSVLRDSLYLLACAVFMAGCIKLWFGKGTGAWLIGAAMMMAGFIRYEAFELLLLLPVILIGAIRHHRMKWSGGLVWAGQICAGMMISLIGCLCVVGAGWQSYRDWFRVIMLRFL